MQLRKCLFTVAGVLMLAGASFAGEFKLQLRSQKETPADSGKFEVAVQPETWKAEETAVIVCDVWDYHHCLNAVRRMDEFVPRMNEVLKQARLRGAIVIHSPSDCMPAYERHPARQRAVAAPAARTKPQEIEFWCSRIPSEKSAIFPIDQSDGGEDDDLVEHAGWAAKLQSLGRNPGMPWKSQSPLIEIDSEHDYISDRGLEVWNILESKGVKNVILVGVHTNMCVLGRPFGLRQMARNGKHVVLMRDLTDSMYNPKRWPYVDHFTGHDLVVSHTERYVCATISSDQILGGKSFRSKYDTRGATGVRELSARPPINRETFGRQWTVATLPTDWKAATHGVFERYAGTAWIRCSVRISSADLNGNQPVTVSLATESERPTVWLNGHQLKASVADSKTSSFQINREWIAVDDINLLVVRMEIPKEAAGLKEVPVLNLPGKNHTLKGRWQFRFGDDPTWSNIPLPAKFGIGPDILFDL